MLTRVHSSSLVSTISRAQRADLSRFYIIRQWHEIKHDLIYSLPTYHISNCRKKYIKNKNEQTHVCVPCAVDFNKPVSGWTWMWLNHRKLPQLNTQALEVYTEYILKAAETKALGRSPEKQTSRPGERRGQRAHSQLLFQSDWKQTLRTTEQHER